jgi:hypothetical protein
MHIDNIEQEVNSWFMGPLEQKSSNNSFMLSNQEEQELQKLFTGDLSVNNRLHVEPKGSTIKPVDATLQENAYIWGSIKESEKYRHVTNRSHQKINNYKNIYDLCIKKSGNTTVAIQPNHKRTTAQSIAFNIFVVKSNAKKKYRKYEVCLPNGYFAQDANICELEEGKTSIEFTN